MASFVGCKGASFGFPLLDHMHRYCEHVLIRQNLNTETCFASKQLNILISSSAFRNVLLAAAFLKSNSQTLQSSKGLRANCL